MKEQQALSIQRENARKIDPDKNVTRSANFGLVEATGNWAIDVLDKANEPRTFIQEGKEYIVFENPLGETRIVTVGGGER